MTKSVVQVAEVSKTFHTEDREVQALDALSTEIGGGCITGLVGPDGAGKTTLMRLIAGLLSPDQGNITVLGLDSVRDTDAVHQRIGYMPQRFGLYEDLTVSENMNLHATLQGLGPVERTARFDDLLGFTGLGPFGDRLAGALSGGMKQKLGLACTLINPPQLLLLDEPSVGVDPLSRRELWSIVRGLATEGMAILWSTAYLDEADRCDEVLMLSNGTLLDQGKPGHFSSAMAGRTFAVKLNGADKRDLQRQATKLPGIVDALIQGRNLRLVVDEGTGAPKASDLAGDQNDGQALSISPVEPRFEDAFVARLKDTVPRADAPPDPDQEIEQKDTVSQDSPVGVVIETRNLTRRFGEFCAVDEVSFAVERGEIFGLLGPNGAGKSTTFKMLCGLLSPSSGTATVTGIDLAHAPATARERIGYMSQKFSLYGNLTVMENLNFFSGVYGLAGNTRRTRIDEVVAEFDLSPYLDSLSADLPLGFKQRLSLAAAVMHDPAILFLDEPTSGVDPLTRREFWQRINNMAARGVTILVTSHFMDEAEYCDRLAIIYRGRIIATGMPDDIKERFTLAGQPEATLEEAFISLIESYDREHPQ